MADVIAAGAAPWLAYPLTVGGLACIAADCVAALTVLASSPGLMVRQPLERAGCVLAACDYHAEAAPYKASFASVLPSGGRGAAGRPATKTAFCFALGHRVQAARTTEPAAAYASLIARAWQAFASDCGYGVAIARAAVELCAKDHVPIGLAVSSTDGGFSSESGPTVGIGCAA